MKSETQNCRAIDVTPRAYIHNKTKSYFCLLWTPSHERTRVGQPTRTYPQQPCSDTGCSLEDLPEAIDDKEICARSRTLAERERERERERENCVSQQ